MARRKGDFSIDLKGRKRSEGLLLEVPPPAGRHRGKRGEQGANSSLIAQVIIPKFF